MRALGHLFRLARHLLVLVLVVVAVAGCQVKVAVDTTVNRDGSGTVAVGVGLDDKAMTRVGSLDLQVRLSDLAASGWTVTKAQKEGDGLTWLRATKPFVNADDLKVVIAEIAGTDGLLKGFTFTKTEDGDTTYRLTGTLDPTKGVATFGDTDLAKRLGGDPFAGLVQEVEKEEGKSAADMVTFDITASVGGAPAKVFHPTLKDTQPTPVDVSQVDPKPPSVMLGVVLLVMGVAAIAVVLMLARARRRFAPR